MAEVVIKEKVKDVNVAEFVGKMIARRETERCLTVFFRCTTQQGAKDIYKQYEDPFLFAGIKP